MSSRLRLSLPWPCDQIHAHRSPLAAIVLSSNGMYIATTSEQGTIIRVHLVSEATKSNSFRWRTYPSTIFSLSFGSSMQLPDILVAPTSSGSVHVFSPEFAINQRGRRSSSLLGSIIPDSVTDALDPAHHHILHKVVPAGMKSYAVIHKVLIQLGDILHRGEDEISIFSLLRSLDIQAKAKGGAVFQVNGNHETMNVEGDFKYVDSGALEECLDFLEYLDDYENNWEEAFVSWIGVPARWRGDRKMSQNYWGPWNLVK